MAGTIVDPPPGPHTEGPRLSSLVVQTSTDGAALPRVFGVARLAGNVIWSSGLKESSHDITAGGGSGGGGPTSTQYTYSVDCAIAICEGEIAGIRRFWADSKLIYDASSTAGVDALIASSATAKGIRIYRGTETQGKDPLIQATVGDANTPAYLGTAYIVLEDFQLANFGNRLPNFTFEVVENGTYSLLLQNGAGYNFGTDEQLFKACVDDKGTVRLASLVSLGYNAGGGGYAVQVNMWSVINGIKKLRFSAILYLGTLGAPSTNWCITQDPNEDTVFLSYNGTFFVLIEFGTNGVPQCYRLKNVANSLAAGRVWVDARRVILADDSYGICVYYRSQFTSGPIINNYVGYYGTGMYLPYAVTQDLPRIRLAVPSGTQYVCNIALDETYCYVGTYAGTTGYIHRVSLAQLEALFGDHPSSDVTWTTLSYSIPTSGSGQSRTTVDVGTITGSVFNVETEGSFQELFKTELFDALSYIGNMPIQSYLNFTDNFYTIQELENNLLFLASKNGYVLASYGLLLMPAPIALKDVVSSILGYEPVGTGQPVLTASSYDVSAITGNIRGYVITQPMTPRAALEPLMSAYFFDAMEEDAKIKLIPRTGTVTRALTVDDLGAAESPGAPQIQVTHTNQTELPSQINVSYSDINNDFQPGMASARRLTAKHDNLVTISLPIILTSQEANQIAEKAINAAWWSSRNSYNFSLTYAHLALSPTDVVSFPLAGQTVLARLTGMDVGAPGLIKCTAVPELASLYVGSAVAADDAGIGQILTYPSSTLLTMLDCCMLRDQDTTPGWYIALGGYGATWAGAALFKSADSGATWISAASAAPISAVTRGTASLLPASDCRVWDKSSTLTVMLYAGSLSSCTEDALLGGANPALVGAPGRWEMLQFRDATLNSDGTYTLTNFLRGRRGTEWAAGLHAVGDIFLVPTTTTIQNIEATPSEIGATQQWVAVPSGEALESQIPETDTYTGERLRPLAPVNVSATLNADSSYTIKWDRRDRIAKAFHGMALPLSEKTEAYEVEILDVSGVVDAVQSVASLTSTIISTYSQGYIGGVATLDAVVPVGLVSTIGTHCLTIEHNYTSGGEYIVISKRIASTMSLVNSVGTGAIWKAQDRFHSWCADGTGIIYVSVHTTNSGLRGSCIRIDTNTMVATHEYSTGIPADAGSVVLAGNYVYFQTPYSGRIIKLNASDLSYVADATPTSTYYLSDGTDIYGTDGTDIKKINGSTGVVTTLLAAASGYSYDPLFISSGYIYAMSTNWPNRDLVKVQISSPSRVLLKSSVTDTFKSRFPVSGNVACLNSVYNITSNSFYKLPTGSALFIGNDGANHAYSWTSTDIIDGTRVAQSGGYNYTYPIGNMLETGFSYNWQVYTPVVLSAGMRVNVYQLSSVVGRGHPGTITI